MSFEEIREKLKDLRKENCLTQTVLGEKLGLRQQDIAKIENDPKHRITDEEIYKYAKFFSVSADYLLGLTRPKTNNKDIQFICDYTGLSEEAIETLHHFETPTYMNTIDFIEKLITKIGDTSIFSINLDILVDDTTLLAELYDALILKRNNAEPTIVGIDDENIIKEIKERIIYLQQSDSEDIDALEDTTNSMKYRLTRFLNEFIEEFSCTGSGFNFKEFEKLENIFHKRGV